jgi:Cellulase (glycosyl hydrolase family 5)
MIKKLHPKTKRAAFFIWMGSFLTFAFFSIHVLYPYMNIYLNFNIYSFLSSRSNSTSGFYGENIDMSQILPASQHYIVNSKGKDLIDIAADLGINLIRITNGQRSFNNNADSLYTKEQWDQVLNKMQSKGIKALILIETASNNRDYYTRDIRPAYLNLVQKYIDSGVFSNPDVYAVDIKNEPLLTEANISMLQAAHTMIKVKYPKLKQTIGWWATTKSPADPYNPNNYNWSDFSAGQKIANIVDFYSIHMYGLDTANLGPDIKTKVFVSRVENGLQTKKPILIEEFGEANGDAVSDQDTIGNPALQANVYQGVYQALKEMRSSQLIGAVAFDFYSRNHNPDAWAIVKNSGNYLFPAAYILQEYALGKNDPSLQSATVVTSESYLVKNTDNYSTKNLHISDRIGFKLHLDSSKNYAFCLSNNGILQGVEALHYDPVSLSYYAVYQATSEGSAQLNIVPNTNCNTNDMFTPSVYTLTITVQPTFRRVIDRKTEIR